MKKSRKTRMTAEAFVSWVNDPEVEPGEEIEYVRGESCAGTQVAFEARKAAESGLVFLFQHRYGPFDFGYRARRIDKKTAKVIAPEAW